jgi:predicted ATP-grasp superfamily ATP-dependent carboligase
MITTLYILGNHIQALGLSRQAKKIGLTVHLFNKEWASVARYSNTCDHFHLFKDDSHLLEILTSSASKAKDTLLIATNDSLINFLSVNNQELSSLYYVSVPSPSVIDICYNKRRTYQKAMELGIPIPLSYFPDTISEIEELADNIIYPVVIKPAIMHTFHKKTGKKVFFCKTKEELLSYYNQIITIIPANEVIVQEFLSGGAKSLYSFGSFFAKGTVYGSFSANRIRQNPMDFGNSTTYAITVSKPDFETLAIKFLESIDYFGLSEVEFMEDPTTGQYKMLEINPRAWKWHSIANKLNINLLEMMVDFLNHKPVAINNDHQVGFAWIERITDTTVVLKEILKGKMKFSDYIASLKLKKESAVWSWNDPLPSIMYLILTPYLFIKRK